jgi:hypothetical protein
MSNNYPPEIAAEHFGENQVMGGRSAKDNSH